MVREIDDQQFRPIRTEEDKAVDEMLEIFNSIKPEPSMRDALREMYRAGYKKEQQQK
jgi:hypothetical protein